MRIIKERKRFGHAEGMVQEKIIKGIYYISETEDVVKVEEKV